MTDDEFRTYRNYVEQSCSIAVGPEKKYLLETRLSRLVAEAQCSTYSQYFEREVRNGTPDTRNRIVDAMTTNETLWFRDGSPWVTLRDLLLPELTRNPQPKRGKLRFWSAGCSTGQEPYSMAMVIDDFCKRNPRFGYTADDFEILATDISTSALEIARSGRYDTFAMQRGFQGDWEPFRKPYFESDGTASTIVPSLRRRVEFRQFNLQNPLLPLGTFDVVMLRYVAIYFSETFRRGLFQRMAGAMRPGTTLFIGGSEALPAGLDWLEHRRHGRGLHYRVASTLA